jgi:hypothetical protein
VLETFFPFAVGVNGKNFMQRNSFFGIFLILAVRTVKGRPLPATEFFALELSLALPALPPLINLPVFSELKVLFPFIEILTVDPDGMHELFIIPGINVSEPRQGVAAKVE